MSPELQIAIQIGLGVIMMLVGVITFLGRMEIGRMIASIAELKVDIADVRADQRANKAELEAKIIEINKELQVLRIESSARDRSNTFFEGAVRDIGADVKKLFERLPQLESRITIMERGK